VRVGRVLGIDVRVHATFLLIVPLFALAGSAGDGPGPLGGVAWLAAIFACVLVHELSHCVVGRRRGAVVHEIVLLPIGGISKLERLPQTAGDELAMAIAGPLASIALGVVAMGLAVLTGASLWPIEILTGPVLAGLAWFNLIVGAFNLLPAFPLDGGRVLRAALERHRDLEAATHTAARLGRALALTLMLAGALFDLWLLIIGIFVYFGAATEEAATRLHVRLEGLTVRDVMRQDVVAAPVGAGIVTPAMPLEPDALRVVVRAPDHVVPVVDAGVVVGSLHLHDIATTLDAREARAREEHGHGLP
jgi:Zn-dependent protease